MNYIYSITKETEDIAVLKMPQPPVHRRTSIYTASVGHAVIDFLNDDDSFGVELLTDGTGDYSVECENEPDFLRALKCFIDICIHNKTSLSIPLFNAFMAGQAEVRAYKIPDETTSFVHAPLSREVFQYSNDSGNLDSVESIMESAFENSGAITEFMEYTLFQCDSYIQVVICSLLMLARRSALIKKCENCGKYFMPENRSDTLYCDRKAPQDPEKTCKDYGARKAWERNLKEDKTANLYRKIYMSKQMLVKRNPDIPEYKQAFAIFKADAKRWKSDIKFGAKTNDEYYEWLKKAREKK